MNSDEDNWQTVSRPRKTKSGEIKAALEEEENSKLIESMSIKPPTVKKKEATPARKTQIPVKIKAPVENVPKAKKKSESPPGFKSLEAALKALDLTEMVKQLEAARIQFNNNDVIMLKTALAFLNEKIRLGKVEDSLFFDKPLDYPNKILPEGLKAIIQPLITKCSSEILNYFFHNLLQSVCEALNKSQSFVGHLIMLEQIAHHQPQVSMANLASTVILRNSYQNQPSICLSLFWALGSAGARDTSYGLKVWSSIMSSVLNFKSYTKYVIDYLLAILTVADRTPTLDITVDEYNAILQAISSNPRYKPKDYERTKQNCIELLNTKVVASLSSGNVKQFFKAILDMCESKPEQFVDAFLDSAQRYPQECFPIWQSNFDQLGKANETIFLHIASNLDKFDSLLESKEACAFLQEIDYEKCPRLLRFRVSEALYLTSCAKASTLSSD